VKKQGRSTKSGVVTEKSAKGSHSAGQRGRNLGGGGGGKFQIRAKPNCNYPNSKIIFTECFVEKKKETGGKKKITGEQE